MKVMFSIVGDPCLVSLEVRIAHALQGKMSEFRLAENIVTVCSRGRKRTRWCQSSLEQCFGFLSGGMCSITYGRC